MAYSKCGLSEKEIEALGAFDQLSGAYLSYLADTGGGVATLKELNQQMDASTVNIGISTFFEAVGVGNLHLVNPAENASIPFFTAAARTQNTVFENVLIKPIGFVVKKGASGVAKIFGKEGAEVAKVLETTVKVEPEEILTKIGDDLDPHPIERGTVLVSDEGKRIVVEDGDVVYMGSGGNGGGKTIGKDPVETRTGQQIIIERDGNVVLDAPARSVSIAEPNPKFAESLIKPDTKSERYVFEHGDETLTATAFVSDDIVLKSNSGEVFLLKKGDQVKILNPDGTVKPEILDGLGQRMLLVKKGDRIVVIRNGKEMFSTEVDGLEAYLYKLEQNPNPIQEVAQSVGQTVNQAFKPGESAEEVLPHLSKALREGTGEVGFETVPSDDLGDRFFTAIGLKRPEKVVRLTVVDGASPELKKAVEVFNESLAIFTAAGGKLPKADQLLTFLTTGPLKQLKAGGGKTSVLSHLENALNRKSVAFLKDLSDARAYADGVAKIHQFYEKLGIDTIYYDFKTGTFREIVQGERFDFNSAKIIPQTEMEEIMAAAQAGKKGVLIVADGSDVGFALAAKGGKPNVREDVLTIDKALFGDGKFVAFVDEIGKQIDRNLSVTDANSKISDLKPESPELLGMKTADDLLNASEEVRNSDALSEFRKSVLEFFKKNESPADLFFSFTSDGVTTYQPFPKDVSVRARSFREMLGQTIEKIKTDSPFKEELIALERGYAEALENGDDAGLLILEKNVESLLDGSRSFEGESGEAISDLAFRIANLKDRWAVLAKAPGIDFQFGTAFRDLKKGGNVWQQIQRFLGMKPKVKEGLVQLAENQAISGKVHSSLSQKIALQEEGAEALRAMPQFAGNDWALLAKSGDLLSSGEGETINLGRDVFSRLAADGRLVGYDATPKRALNLLGGGKISDQPALKPKIFKHANDILTAMKQMVSDARYKAATKDKSTFHILLDKSISFSRQLDELVKLHPDVETVAVRRQLSDTPLEEFPEFAFYDVIRGENDTISYKLIGESASEAEWAKALKEKIKDPENANKVLSVYEGIDRAADLPVTVESKNMAPPVVWASDQIASDSLAQAPMRQRYLALVDATPENIRSHVFTPEEEALLKSVGWTKEDVINAYEAGYFLGVAGKETGLTAENIVAHAEKVLAEEMAQGRFNQAIQDAASAPVNYLKKVREIAVESGATEEQIKQIDALLAKARREEIARSTEILTEPLRGEQIIFEVYARTREAHLKIQKYSVEIEKDVKLTGSLLDDLNTSYRTKDDFMAREKFVGLLDKEIGGWKGKTDSPIDIAQRFATQNNFESLPKLAFVGDSSARPTAPIVAPSQADTPIVVPEAVQKTPVVGGLAQFLAQNWTLMKGPKIGVREPINLRTTDWRLLPGAVVNNGLHWWASRPEVDKPISVGQAGGQVTFFNRQYQRFANWQRERQRQALERAKQQTAAREFEAQVQKLVSKFAVQISQDLDQTVDRSSIVGVEVESKSMADHLITEVVSDKLRDWTDTELKTSVYQQVMVDTNNEQLADEVYERIVSMVQAFVKAQIDRVKIESKTVVIEKSDPVVGSGFVRGFHTGVGYEQGQDMVGFGKHAMAVADGVTGDEKDTNQGRINAQVANHIVWSFVEWADDLVKQGFTVFQISSIAQNFVSDQQKLALKQRGAAAFMGVVVDKNGDGLVIRVGDVEARIVRQGKIIEIDSLDNKAVVKVRDRDNLTAEEEDEIGRGFRAGGQAGVSVIDEQGKVLERPNLFGNSNFIGANVTRLTLVPGDRVVLSSDAVRKVGAGAEKVIIFAARSADPSKIAKDIVAKIPSVNDDVSAVVMVIPEAKTRKVSVLKINKRGAKVPTQVRLNSGPTLGDIEEIFGFNFKTLTADLVKLFNQFLGRVSKKDIGQGSPEKNFTWEVQGVTPRNLVFNIQVDSERAEVDANYADEVFKKSKIVAQRQAAAGVFHGTTRGIIDADWVGGRNLKDPYTYFTTDYQRAVKDYALGGRSRINNLNVDDNPVLLEIKLPTGILNDLELDINPSERLVLGMIPEQFKIKGKLFHQGNNWWIETSKGKFPIEVTEHKVDVFPIDSVTPLKVGVPGLVEVEVPKLQINLFRKMGQFAQTLVREYWGESQKMRIVPGFPGSNFIKAWKSAWDMKFGSEKKARDLNLSQGENYVVGRAEHLGVNRDELVHAYQVAAEKVSRDGEIGEGLRLAETTLGVWNPNLERDVKHGLEIDFPRNLESLDIPTELPSLGSQTYVYYLGDLPSQKISQYFVDLSRVSFAFPDVSGANFPVTVTRIQNFLRAPGLVLDPTMTDLFSTVESAAKNGDLILMFDKNRKVVAAFSLRANGKVEFIAGVKNIDWKDKLTIEKKLARALRTQTIVAGGSSLANVLERERSAFTYSQARRSNDLIDLARPTDNKEWFTIELSNYPDEFIQAREEIRQRFGDEVLGKVFFLGGTARRILLSNVFATGIFSDMDIGFYGDLDQEIKDQIVKILEDKMLEAKKFGIVTTDVLTDENRFFGIQMKSEGYSDVFEYLRDDLGPTTDKFAIDLNGRVFDPHGGLADAKFGRLRLAGKIDSDTLNTREIFRLIRFSAEYDLELDSSLVKLLIDLTNNRAGIRKEIVDGLINGEDHFGFYYLWGKALNNASSGKRLVTILKKIGLYDDIQNAILIANKYRQIDGEAELRTLPDIANDKGLLLAGISHGGYSYSDLRHTGVVLKSNKKLNINRLNDVYYEYIYRGRLAKSKLDSVDNDQDDQNDLRSSNTYNVLGFGPSQLYDLGKRIERRIFGPDWRGVDEWIRERLSPLLGRVGPEGESGEDLEGEVLDQPTVFQPVLRDGGQSPIDTYNVSSVSSERFDFALPRSLYLLTTIRDILRQRFGLPPIEMRFESPVMYENAILELAQNEGINVVGKPKSFFDEEGVSAMFYEPTNTILYNVEDPPRARSIFLEHEFVHGLVKKRWPQLIDNPLNEVIAYLVGAGTDFLRNEESLDLLVFLIDRSLSYNDLNNLNVIDGLQDLNKPPIEPGKVFDGPEELARIRKLPSSERRAAMQDFRRKLAYQMEGLALAQEKIVGEIEQNPDMSFQQIAQVFDEMVKKFGFPGRIRAKVEVLIGKYVLQHQKVVDLRKSGSDEELFERFFDQKPKGKFIVVARPLALGFYVFDSEDYFAATGLTEGQGVAILRSKNPEADNLVYVVRPTGDLNNPANFLLLISSDEHEQRELLQKFFSFYEESSVYVEGVFTKGLAEGATRQEVSDLIDVIIDTAKVKQLNLGKIELLAHLKQADFLGFPEKETRDFVNGQLLSPGSEYDVWVNTKPLMQKKLPELFPREYQDIIGKKLDDVPGSITEDSNYRRAVIGSIDAYFDLKNAGYSYEGAFALLHNQPLSTWPKVVKRAIQPNLNEFEINYLLATDRVSSNLLISKRGSILRSIGSLVDDPNPLVAERAKEIVELVQSGDIPAGEVLFKTSGDPQLLNTQNPVPPADIPPPGGEQVVSETVRGKKRRDDESDGDNTRTVEVKVGADQMPVSDVSVNEIRGKSNSGGDDVVGGLVDSDAKPVVDNTLSKQEQDLLFGGTELDPAFLALKREDIINFLRNFVTLDSADPTKNQMRLRANEILDLMDSRNWEGVANQKIKLATWPVKGGSGRERFENVQLEFVNASASMISGLKQFLVQFLNSENAAIYGKFNVENDRIVVDFESGKERIGFPDEGMVIAFKIRHGEGGDLILEILAQGEGGRIGENEKEKFENRLLEIWKIEISHLADGAKISISGQADEGVRSTTVNDVNGSALPMEMGSNGILGDQSQSSDPGEARKVRNAADDQTRHDNAISSVASEGGKSPSPHAVGNGGMTLVEGKASELGIGLDLLREAYSRAYQEVEGGGGAVEAMAAAKQVIGAENWSGQIAGIIRMGLEKDFGVLHVDAEQRKKTDAGVAPVLQSIDEEIEEGLKRINSQIEAFTNDANQSLIFSGNSIDDILNEVFKNIEDRINAGPQDFGREKVHIRYDELKTGFSSDMRSIGEARGEIAKLLKLLDFQSDDFDPDLKKYLEVITSDTESKLTREEALKAFEEKVNSIRVKVVDQLNEVKRILEVFLSPFVKYSKLYNNSGGIIEITAQANGEIGESNIVFRFGKALDSFINSAREVELVFNKRLGVVEDESIRSSELVLAEQINELQPWQERNSGEINDFEPIREYLVGLPHFDLWSEYSELPPDVLEDQGILEVDLERVVDAAIIDNWGSIRRSGNNDEFFGNYKIETFLKFIQRDRDLGVDPTLESTDPITLYDLGGVYVAVGGTHRLAGYKAAGLLKIRAKVKRLTEKAALNPWDYTKNPSKAKAELERARASLGRTTRFDHTFSGMTNYEPLGLEFYYSGEKFRKAVINDQTGHPFTVSEKRNIYEFFQSLDQKKRDEIMGIEDVDQRRVEILKLYENSKAGGGVRSATVNNLNVTSSEVPKEAWDGLLKEAGEEATIEQIREAAEVRFKELGKEGDYSFREWILNVERTRAEDEVRRDEMRLQALYRAVFNEGKEFSNTQEASQDKRVTDFVVDTYIQLGRAAYKAVKEKGLPISETARVFDEMLLTVFPETIDFSEVLKPEGIDSLLDVYGVDGLLNGWLNNFLIKKQNNNVFRPRENILADLALKIAGDVSDNLHKTSGEVDNLKAEDLMSPVPVRGESRFKKAVEKARQGVVTATVIWAALTSLTGSVPKTGVNATGFVGRVATLNEGPINSVSPDVEKLRDLFAYWGEVHSSAVVPVVSDRLDAENAASVTTEPEHKIIEKSELLQLLAKQMTKDFDHGVLLEMIGGKAIAGSVDVLDRDKLKEQEFGLLGGDMFTSFPDGDHEAVLEEVLGNLFDKELIGNGKVLVRGNNVLFIDRDTDALSSWVVHIVDGKPSYFITNFKIPISDFETIAGIVSRASESSIGERQMLLAKFLSYQSEDKELILRFLKDNDVADVGEFFLALRSLMFGKVSIPPSKSIPILFRANEILAQKGIKIDGSSLATWFASNYYYYFETGSEQRDPDSFPEEVAVMSTAFNELLENESLREIIKSEDLNLSQIAQMMAFTNWIYHLSPEESADLMKNGVRDYALSLDEPPKVQTDTGRKLNGALSAGRGNVASLVESGYVVGGERARPALAGMRNFGVPDYVDFFASELGIPRQLIFSTLALEGYGNWIEKSTSGDGFVHFFTNYLHLSTFFVMGIDQTSLFQEQLSKTSNKYLLEGLFVGRGREVTNELGLPAEDWKLKSPESGIRYTAVLLKYYWDMVLVDANKINFELDEETRVRLIFAYWNMGPTRGKQLMKYVAANHDSFDFINIGTWGNDFKNSKVHFIYTNRGWAIYRFYADILSEDKSLK